MRILFISLWLPFPLNSGTRQRTYHVMKSLAAQCKLTLVCPTPAGKTCPQLEGLSPLVEKTFLYPVESYRCPAVPDDSVPAPVAKALNLIRLIPSHLHPVRPAAFRIWESAAANRLLAQLANDPWDVIWAYRFPSYLALPAGVKQRVIVDLDDLEHEKKRYAIDHSRLRPRLVYDYIEYFRLRRMELNLPNLPHEIVVCSEEQKMKLGGGPAIHVLPNGVDLPDGAESVQQTPPDSSMIFCGGMAYGANIDAALFFCREILPLIHLHRPDAILYIVGKNPPASVRNLHDGSRVLVTGEVPEVAPFYRKAALAVCPIRYGSGTRIKILDAFAFRKPVVSTTIGAEGIAINPGGNILLADRPEDFAAACVSIMNDPSLARRLSTSGFALVEKEYQWKIIERKVSAILASKPPAGSRLVE